MVNVSILIPINDVSVYLKKAIYSIATQSYRSFKIIVVVTADVEFEVKKLFEQIIELNDIEIIYIVPVLPGISFALNLGINFCKTKYLARMDGDDISSPDRLQRQVKYLEDNNDVGVLGSRTLFIDEDDKIISNWSMKYYENDRQIRSALRYRMPLCHPGIMFRTRLLIEMKGYLHGLSAEDHDLYLRIRRNSKLKFYNLNEVLIYYRRHSDQLTKIENSFKAFYDIASFLFREFLYSLDIIFIFGIIANHPHARQLRAIKRIFIKR